MASTTRVVWKCQLCESRYALLHDLVGHVRAAHSAESQLNFVCQVNGCPTTFKNTNSWYKHVRRLHKQEYFTRDSFEVSIQSPDQEEDQEMDDSVVPDTGDGHNMDFVNHSEQNFDTLSPPTSLSQDATAGMLLKLKEKHKLSHAAVDEVIQVVGIVADHVVMKTLSAVQQSAEDHGIDTDTPFFRSLPDIAENVSNPLSSLGTAYKQQSYVAKNFPYVVNLIHLVNYEVIMVSIICRIPFGVRLEHM